MCVYMYGYIYTHKILHIYVQYIYLLCLYVLTSGSQHKTLNARVFVK